MKGAACRTYLKTESMLDLIQSKPCGVGILNLAISNAWRSHNMCVERALALSLVWAFVEPHAVLVELVRSSERVDSRVATS